MGLATQGNPLALMASASQQLVAEGKVAVMSAINVQAPRMTSDAATRTVAPHMGTEAPVPGVAQIPRLKMCALVQQASHAV